MIISQSLYHIPTVFGCPSSSGNFDSFPGFHIIYLFYFLCCPYIYRLVLIDLFSIPHHWFLTIIKFHQIYF